MRRISGEDLVGAVAVEVAGGLVGQHQRRLEHQRARDRHALLHAAGQLARPLVQRIAQADGGEQRARALALRGVTRPVAHQRRQRHVLQRAEGRQQVVELEHEAQRLAPAQRQRLRRRAPSSPRLDAVAAAVGRSSRPDDVQQRALARARRPDQGRRTRRAPSVRSTPCSTSASFGRPTL
jgi:hypothetical protein